MVFSKEFKVRFGDIDHAGIVYYPTLVNYTHVAMEDFFDEHLGHPYARVLNEHRIGLPTVHFEMDFKKPLRYGDRIEHESMIARLGRTSVVWRHRFYLVGTVNPEQEPFLGELAAEARAVTVCTDLESLKKVPVPDWLRERIERC